MLKTLDPSCPVLMPGIHVLEACTVEDVDGRDKPGHDVESAVAILSARTSPMPEVPSPITAWWRHAPTS
jgi:hypothetical protein